MEFSKSVLLSVVFSILFVMASYQVSGFGVSSPYWDEKALVLSPGESKDIVLELQNMVGDEDIVLRAEVEEGSEIVTLVDEDLDYEVPLIFYTVHYFPYDKHDLVHEKQLPEFEYFLQLAVLLFHLTNLLTQHHHKFLLDLVLNQIVRNNLEVPFHNLQTMQF